jgi:ABC-type phosphate transport system substrate-binding protein
MPFVRLLLTLWLAMLPSMGLAIEFTLVTHRDNPVDSLRLTEVRDIYLGKKVFWSGGRAITVLLQEDGELHRAFSLKVLGKSPRQLHLYWKRILFSGEGVPPRKLPNDSAVIEMVAANPRAIGYIDARHLDGRIKAIRINME